MADTSRRSVVIAAPAAAVAAVLCDFAEYPRWVSAAKRVEVVASGADGRASTVAFELDAGMVADEFTLAYEYAEDLSRIEWHLVAPSKMQRNQLGSYDIADNGDGTSTVTYTLCVESALGLLDMFKRKVDRVIMDTALADLKRRVELLQGSPREPRGQG